MAFCNHCGKQVPDNAAFCPECGGRLTPAAPNSAYNGNAAPQQPRVQVQPTQPYSAPYTPPQTQPMNYYKFVIWIQLFLAALSGAVHGLGLLFGFWYELVSNINAQWYYLFFPAMHVVDILFGLAYIALAVGAVYTRQEMAHFKKNAPDLYYLFLIASAVLSFLYTVLQGIICATASAIPGAVGSLITSIVILVLCHIYFEKRRSQFCN